MVLRMVFKERVYAFRVFCIVVDKLYFFRMLRLIYFYISKTLLKKYIFYFIF